MYLVLVLKLVFVALTYHVFRFSSVSIIVLTPTSFRNHRTYPPPPTAEPPWRKKQVVLAILLSGLATSSWTSSNKESNSLLAMVAVILSLGRASGIFARHALVKLLEIAMGTYINNRHRPGEGRTATAAAAATGLSKVVGVLMAGAVFARAVGAGAKPGVVLFRLAAVGFLGLYLATMFMDVTEGTVAGGMGSWGAGAAGGAGGRDSAVWLSVCDFVDENPPPAGYYGDVGVGTGRVVKES